MPAPPSTWNDKKLKFAAFARIKEHSEMSTFRACFLYFLFVSIDFYAYLKGFRIFNLLKVFPVTRFPVAPLLVTIITLTLTPPLCHKSANFRARKQSMLFNVRTSRGLKNGVCKDGVRERERVFIPVSRRSGHYNGRMPCASASWLSRITVAANSGIRLLQMQSYSAPSVRPSHKHAKFRSAKGLIL